MIDLTHDLPVVRQCNILCLDRSAAFYSSQPTSTEYLVLIHRIDELHLEHPFAGSRIQAPDRMLRDLLQLEGHQIGACISAH